MEPFLTIADTADPAQVIEFIAEGDTVHFGRGAPGIELVVRTRPGQPSLSRVAGKVWRQWNQLWIANLSQSHDLYLQEASMPSEHPLPPRRRSGVHARTVPGHRCFVTGPGDGWALVVDQRLSGSSGDLAPSPQSQPGGDRGLAGGGMVEDDGEITLRAPALPIELRDVAAALCEPLLTRGARLPATHRHISRRLGISQKAVRLRVDRLVELYEDHNPVLRRRREDRDRRLAGPELVRGAGGVWRPPPMASPVSPASTARGEARGSATETPQPELPYSFDVAYLLIRRGLVTLADITRLDLERGGGAVAPVCHDDDHARAIG